MYRCAWGWVGVWGKRRFYEVGEGGGMCEVPESSQRDHTDANNSIRDQNTQVRSHWEYVPRIMVGRIQ